MNLLPFQGGKDFEQITSRVGPRHSRETEDSVHLLFEKITYAEGGRSGAFSSAYSAASQDESVKVPTVESRKRRR